MKKNALVRILLYSVSLFLLLLIFAAGIAAAGAGNSFYLPGGLLLNLGSPGQDEAVTSEAGQADPQEVDEILVKWASGSIVVQPGDVRQLEFRCSGSIQDPGMYWYQNGRELTIEFTKTNVFFGLGYTSGSKDLVITVPRDWRCGELAFQVGSANVQLDALTIEDLDFQGASGTLTADGCTLNRLEADTASGDIYFSGTADALDFDSASGDLVATLSNVPKRISMDSTSGDLDLTLPQSAGFTVKLDSLSGHFTSDFSTSLKGGRYCCGNEACIIEADSMSGDVFIRKG